MIDNNMDFVDIFERKLCEYTGAKYAVCTDCCTNAILISLHLKKVLGLISYAVIVPNRTYMSVPMTLKLFGFNVRFDETNEWEEYYQIFDSRGKNGTGVYDCAVFFKPNMFRKIKGDWNKLVCVSFQQKKRLSLGRGGAILTDNKQHYDILKRLVYDGRNLHMRDVDEITMNPNNIALGFHSYLEPEKAARGIQILNQPSLMRPYRKITYADYADVSNLSYEYLP